MKKGKIILFLVLFTSLMLLCNNNVGAYSIENVYVLDINNENKAVEASNEVEVPNTMKSESTLLIAVSMFDIALGIGIINYVRKNKVKE